MIKFKQNQQVVDLRGNKGYVLSDNGSTVIVCFGNCEVKQVHASKILAV
jgi:hypothetical protein